MGLYDSFYMKLKCPCCGKDGFREWQTKELWCEMLHINIGDNVKDIEDTEYGGFHIYDGEVPVYNFCQECECWVDALAIIKNGYFVNVKVVTTEPSWFDVNDYKHGDNNYHKEED